MIETRHSVTLVVVRRGVKPLQERHRSADVPIRFQNAVHFRDDLIRVLHVLKNRFRDDGAENRVLEGKAMPVADDIDIRRGFDFEVDSVWRASIKPRSQI